MFTRAGFSQKIRSICVGLVSRIGRPGVVRGYLVRWPACGDVAWASSTQICWPDQVIIHSFIRLGPPYYYGDRSALGRRLPR